jgi:hypothetical protein
MFFIAIIYYLKTHTILTYIFFYFYYLLHSKFQNERNEFVN